MAELRGNSTCGGYKILTTGDTAKSIRISDEGDNFAADNVEEALEELATKTLPKTGGTIEGTLQVGTNGITLNIPENGEITSGEDFKIIKNQPWLTLDSSSSGSNAIEQAAGISIGESGKKGSAAMHITYTGDGYAHIGMGSVDEATSLPEHEAMRLHYQNKNAKFLGEIQPHIALKTSSQHVAGAINELFQSVSNGKSTVASAITDMGVVTSSGATFGTMALNIRNIRTSNIDDTVLYGNGANGVFNSTGNVTWGSSGTNLYKYSKFTLNTGHTLTCSPNNSSIVIYVQGDCIINGTIHLNGKITGNFSNSPSSITAPALFNSSVSSYGSEVFYGSRLRNLIYVNGSNVSNSSGSSSNMQVGGRGGNGGSSTNSGSSGQTAYCGGGGAGGRGGSYVVDNGSSGSTSYSGGQGGYGGGTIILIVGGDLTIGSSGKIQANGARGSNGSSSAGDGGGGGGGRIILIHRGKYTNRGSLQANGGSGYGNGRAGYAGYIKVLQGI